MATAEQLKALLTSHLEGDEARFYAIALQVAAGAARKGQGRLSQELRDLVDQGKKRGIRKGSPSPSHLVPVDRELADLVAVSRPSVRLTDMVLVPDARARLERILLENRQAAKLRTHGLQPRRKVLLLGAPGSGKTMTAAAIAGELHKPLFSVVLEGLITKYLGETAAKLRVLFSAMGSSPGVYFFDEFDAIGGQRASSNDVGEIRRVLSSFLQLLEQDDSDSLIVAATNNASLLDPALFRRFDDVIEYVLPGRDLVRQLVANRLAAFGAGEIEWDRVLDEATGLSHAEISLACDDAAKAQILGDRESLETSDLIRALSERRLARGLGERAEMEGGERATEPGAVAPSTG